MSQNVEYAGKPLESFGEYWWTVRIWDDLGRKGDNAEHARFEMGITEHSKWRGHWVGPGVPFLADRMDGDVREVLWAPLLRKEFSIVGEVKTRAPISLGWGGMSFMSTAER